MFTVFPTILCTDQELEDLKAELKRNRDVVGAIPTIKVTDWVHYFDVGKPAAKEPAHG